MIRPNIPNRDFTDPMREIVEVKVGAGTDTLVLACGHQIARDHKKQWGKRTRCHGCRVWNEVPA